MIKISKLKINKANPRYITEQQIEKLKKSIQEFPEMMRLRPIVVDKTGTVLGGNMRLQALKLLGYKELKDEWVIYAEELTEEQKQEFIIKDNVGFGSWDWEIIANEWDPLKIEEWGLETPGYEYDGGEDDDSFSLESGAKEGIQQMTFSLADQQVEAIKNALADIKKTEEFKYIETFGNENGNGNALYLLIMQWAEQKK